MRADFSRLPLYVGGFMGPFGTVVIVPMYPELREEYLASSAAVNLGFSLYLIPFALLLLVSGTLGERWGRRRTVRGTYALYTVASLVCALAPTLGVFIVGRMLQGVANAFITPLLVAGLAETVAPDRFGRTLGIYSSFQALGSGLGPIVGGLAADSTWQLAFYGTAAVSATLALFPPPGEPRTQALAPPWRALMSPHLVALGVGFFFIAAGPLTAGVLVGVVARDVLGVSGTTAGLILFAGAMCALALGPVWGRALERLGPMTFGIVGATAGLAITALLGFVDRALTLGLLWAAGAGLTAIVVVAYQAVGATILPDNRGGALSFILSFRFLGHAAGPLVFVPLLDRTLWGTWLGAAACGVVTLTVFVVLRSRLAES